MSAASERAPGSPESASKPTVSLETDFLEKFSTLPRPAMAVNAVKDGFVETRIGFRGISPADAETIVVGRFVKRAFDINDSGLIVGQAETAKYEVHPAAWLLNADGTIDGALDLQVDKKTFAGSRIGRANAVSSNGLVVGEMGIPVTAKNNAGETHAVVVGDSLIVPASAPHQVIPTGGAPIVLMTMHVPDPPQNWPPAN